MTKLSSFQKKFLRGLAHGLKPIVMIGQKGISETLMQSVAAALKKHELIKVKFIDSKEKEYKQKVVDAIAEDTGCGIVGMIGHTAILYLPQKDSQKRKIVIPEK